MSAWMAAAGLGEMAGNYFMNQANNISNAKEAKKQREWQTNMSNTAHQREVADLKAAGLNPILGMTGGGASSPSGAQAQMNAANMDGALTKTVTTALDRDRLRKEVKAVDSQIELNKQAAQTQQSQEYLNNVNAANVNWDANKKRATFDSDVRTIRTENSARAANANRSESQSNIDSKLQNVDAVLNRVQKLIPFTK